MQDKQQNTSKQTRSDISAQIWASFLYTLYPKADQNELIRRLPSDLASVNPSDVNQVLGTIRNYSRSRVFNEGRFRTNLRTRGINLEEIGNINDDIRRAFGEKIIDAEYKVVEDEKQEDLEVGTAEFVDDEAEVVQAVSDRVVQVDSDLEGAELVRPSEVDEIDIAEAKARQRVQGEKFARGVIGKVSREEVGAQTVEYIKDQTGLGEVEIRKIAEEYETKQGVAKPMTVVEIDRELDAIFKDTNKRGVTRRVDNLITQAAKSGTPVSVVSDRVLKKSDPFVSDQVKIAEEKKVEYRQRRASILQARSEARKQAIASRFDKYKQVDPQVQLEREKIIAGVKQARADKARPAVRVDIYNTEQAFNFRNPKAGTRILDDGGVFTDGVVSVIGQVVDVNAKPGQDPNMVVNGKIFARGNEAKLRAVNQLVHEEVERQRITRANYKTLHNELRGMGVSPSASMDDAIWRIAEKTADIAVEASSVARSDPSQALNMGELNQARRLAFEALKDPQIIEMVQDEIKSVAMQDPSLSAREVENITEGFSKTLAPILPTTVGAIGLRQTSLLVDETGIGKVASTEGFQTPDGKIVTVPQEYIVESTDPSKRISDTVQEYVRSGVISDASAGAVQAMATKSMEQEYKEFMNRGAVGYAASFPFRMTFKQLAPQKLQAEVAKLQEMKEGGDKSKAYQMSKAPPLSILSVGVVDELKVMSGLWGRHQRYYGKKFGDGPDKYSYFRPFKYGTDGLFWGLNQASSWADHNFLSAVSKRGGGDREKYNWFHNFGFNAKRRTAGVLQKRKRTPTSLVWFMAKLGLGAIVLPAVDATWDVVRATKYGKALVNKFGGLATEREGFFTGMRNAWRYGEGWASSTYYGGTTRHTIGQILRGVNVAGNAAKVAVSPALKGYGYFWVATNLAGISAPVALATTGAYVTFDLLKRIANNPVLGIGYDSVTKFASWGPLAKRFPIFREIALGFNTTAREALDISKMSRLARVSNVVARYLPAEGLMLSQLMMAFGMNPLLALGIGAGSQLAWKLFQRVIQSGPIMAVAGALGTFVSLVNNIAGVSMGLYALDRMGGYSSYLKEFYKFGTDLLQGNFSWASLGSLAGKALPLIATFVSITGIAALLGLPAVIVGLVGTGIVFLADQIIQWVTNGQTSLWSVTLGPLYDNIIGSLGSKAMNVLGAVMGLAMGFWKLLTARNLTELVDAAIMTGFGAMMALGIFSAAAVVGSSLYMPTIPDVSSSALSTSDYFKDVSKTLISINNENGRTFLKYKMTYNYTGGPLANKDMIGVMIMDRVVGIPSDQIDAPCSRLYNYPHMQYFPNDGSGNPTFLDFGPGVNIPPASNINSSLNLIGNDNVNTMRYFRSSDIGKLVEYDFTLCLKDELSNILAENATFSNIFTISGIPIDPSTSNPFTLPPNWENFVERASAIDTRNSKGESPGLTFPITPERCTLTQDYHGVHKGIDLGFPTGTDVYAMSSGTITVAGWQTDGYGNAIYLNHGDGYHTRYAHLSSIDVSVGDKVTAGQKIGEVGSTGRSTGPHLHLEVRQMIRKPGGGDIWAAQNPCSFIQCDLYQRKSNGSCD